MGHYTGELKLKSKSIRMTEQIHDYVNAFPVGNNFNEKLDNILLTCLAGDEAIKKKCLEIERMSEEVRMLAEERDRINKILERQTEVLRGVLRGMEGVVDTK